MENFEFEECTGNHCSIMEHIGKIDEEWYNFLNDKPVNIEIIPPKIYNSWQMSKMNNVDPFSMEASFIETDFNIKNQSNYDEMISQNRNCFHEISEIARQNEFTFVFFDRTCKTKQVHQIASHMKDPLDLKGILGFDAAENHLGTNAIVMAMKDKKPTKFFSGYHYKLQGHKRANAATAPVFNEKGEMIGTFCLLVENPMRLNDAYLLVMTLSRFFELNIRSKTAQDEITFHKRVLKNVMESIPYGILYLDSKDVIQGFNKKVLDLLKIKNEGNISGELSNRIKSRKKLGRLAKDMMLNADNAVYSVSVNEILNDTGQKKDKLLIFNEKKNKIIQKSNGNKAVFIFDDIIGSNAQMLKAKAMAEQVATTTLPILISGESGTGKELFAQSIHNASERRNRPFVAINCGAIPSELVESELFGYEAGAFTGAVKGGKKGIIEAGTGGTIFLDEIESMPLNIQIKMLRTLSTNTISKVGGTKEIPVDVRILSATKKDLLKESDHGRFREDLYYRISTFSIDLPPLRDRINDIGLLSQHFIDKFSQKYNRNELFIDKTFIEALHYYYWRGNIREFENVIERAIVLLMSNNRLTVDYLPEKIQKAFEYKRTKKMLSAQVKENQNSGGLLKLGEEIIIKYVLEETNCCLTKASQILGVSRKTLYNKINESEQLLCVKNSPPS